MSTVNEQALVRARQSRHRGRLSQVRIYLGKQMRFFINESDWKVLPMAAIIAALVTMVIRKRLFQNMEGDLMGAFALTCVCIWNGCFNSIQAVCRERAIVKREHRAGLHISAYVTAHMIYQFILCLLQTGITLAVMIILGNFKDPANPSMRPLNTILMGKGFMTPMMAIDLGITMLLVTYAADMMSLLISSVTHTTTGAMTVMPFILIFQLIFSGGLIPLPEWSKPLSKFTISTYGIRAITCQTNYNESTLITPWNTLVNMRDKEIIGEVSVGKVLDFLNEPALVKYRERVIMPSRNKEEALRDAGSALGLAEDDIDIILASGIFDTEGMSEPVTLGMIIDLANGSKVLQARRDLSVHYHTTVGELMDMIGEERVKEIVQTTTSIHSKKPEYARTADNIAGNWGVLLLYILVFSLLSTVVLEMIDRDKR